MLRMRCRIWRAKLDSAARGPKTIGQMKDSFTVHHVTYTLLIRSEYGPWGPPVFSGTLETVAGQKFEFSTLAELDGWLCDIGGWIDAPASAREGGENTPSCKPIDANRSGKASFESDPSLTKMS